MIADMNNIERTQVDSDLLRTFLAIAETGNVTQAAKLLNRTQSAISVQVRKLEEALSTQLFQRQPRGMALTENGHKLVPEARRVVSDISRIGNLFTSTLSGRINIGIPDDYGLNTLESILRSFTEQNPEVEISVRCSLSMLFPEAVQTGELDLALYAAAPNENIGNALFQEPTIWAAHESFYVPDDQPIPLALYDRQCWWRDAAIKSLEAAGRPYRVVFSSESIAGVKAAIGAGFAVGMLAASAVEPNMRILSKEDGLPSLPHSSMVLLINETSNSELINAMDAAIRRAVKAIDLAPQT
jgi:DNA-binding transcriptional LysR family regulator